MAKLPFWKHYPADWINDTRSLSLAAKGAWIDLLSFMWNAPERGKWAGTYEQLSWLIGCSVQTAQSVVRELHKVATVTERDANVTLMCRRMSRQESSYKSHANRQRDYRERCKRDAFVTPQTLDVRSQKERKEEEKKESAAALSPPASPKGPPAQAPLEKVKAVFPGAKVKEILVEPNWDEAAAFFGNFKRKLKRSPRLVSVSTNGAPRDEVPF